ncbi:unnamed protein product [Hymenolepis diminuta]|uniref:Palmitoyl-protein thioesterase 1 n=1 Tax=Hymenolepis diminuta TaxID=6216 RepID=A0A564YP60_HYMDI|nr:unnamed protein product [Hymenolepis diminuta]
MHFCTLFIVIYVFFCNIVFCEERLGVVVWHGMGDSGEGGGIQHLCTMIKNEIPGVYVLNLMIGSSTVMDRVNSFFMPINEQLDLVCKKIHSDPRLANGFHLIGFSQGGLFVRALAQRCPPKKLGSVISIGGPQEGIYGLPFCPNATAVPLCRYLRTLLSQTAYNDLVQSSFVQAQYWHDPMNEEVYRLKSRFLSEINQENTVNKTYRENLLKAENLVLVRFMSDRTVIPSISEWFGFYHNGSSEATYDYKESKQYTTDCLGLRTLDRQGRLHLLSLPGRHLQFSDDWFRKIIIRKFLNITIY